MPFLGIARLSDGTSARGATIGAPAGPALLTDVRAAAERATCGFDPDRCQVSGWGDAPYGHDQRATAGPGAGRRARPDHPTTHATKEGS
ncbi:hypothetical protein GCM10010103_09040 [Streptomyces paradoxus]